MNITAIKSNSSSIKSQNNYNYNRKVSFYGSPSMGKNLVKNPEDAKLGCLVAASFIVVPFLMLGGAIANIYMKIFNRKSYSLHDIYMELGDSLDKTKYIHKSYFNEQKEKMINLLDNYSTNDDYSNFVKEVLEFLDKNFEQDLTDLDLPFNRLNYVHIIYDAADAAISKNKKTDTKILDIRIKRAREAMQQFNKDNP